MFEATGLDDAATNVSKYDVTFMVDVSKPINTMIVQPIV